MPQRSVIGPGDRYGRLVIVAELKRRDTNRCRFYSSGEGTG